MRSRGSVAVLVLVAAVLVLLLGSLGAQADDTPSIQFGSVQVGVTSQRAWADFTNTGGMTLSVEIVPPASPFGLLWGSGHAQQGQQILETVVVSVGPGGTLPLTITFSPAAAQPYSGSFEVVAFTGFGPFRAIVREFLITLAGTGVSAGAGDTGEGITIIWPPFDEDPTEGPTFGDAETLELIEAKLDTMDGVLDEFRGKFDSLGWWLGRLTWGIPLGIGPTYTNPVPSTSTWEQLTALEAKLDTVDGVLDEFRIKFDNLGWWLGELTWGVPLGIEPTSTNPVPFSSTWEQLASIETKLDLLLLPPEVGPDQPGELEVIEAKLDAIEAKLDPPADDVDELELVEAKLDAIEAKLDPPADGFGELELMEAKLDALEAKLDELLLQPPDGDINIVIHALIIEIKALIVQINTWTFNIHNQIAITKKIYVYEEDTFTATSSTDEREVHVVTPAFDLSGWVDLFELRSGDVVEVEILVNIDGDERQFVTTTFDGDADARLICFDELTGGRMLVVGDDIKILFRQTASADDFVTPIPIGYQFVVESQQ